MKILCLGDNVIDYYINSGEMYPGGNAVNVAVHSSRLGAEAAYLGNFGDDRMAAVIKRALNAFQVETKGCVTIKGASTKYCNYEVIHGERHFCGVELGSNWSGPIILNELELDYMKGFDVIYSSCNAKIEAELHKLKPLTGLFVYDFGEKEKYRTGEYLEKVGGPLDLALFSCERMTCEETLAFCRPIHAAGTKHVLVTMGASGQFVSNGDSLLQGTAQVIEPLDTMGAGDAFLAAFIERLYQCGWQKGKPADPEALKQALAAGNEYSTENCKVKGGFGYKECL